MFIIEATEGNRKWISGIFKNEIDAKEYMNEIPANSRQFQRFYSLEFDFPFYIFEKHGFEFVDEVGLINRINGPQVTDDEVYFTIYKIEFEYRPDKPGMDYMGSLIHVHVTQDFMERYGVDGMDYLKAQELL